MAVEIVVPRLGWSMEEGVFLRWLVEDGSQVEPGEALFEMESDKAAQEVESFDGGKLTFVEETPRGGETVAVGQVLAYLLQEGEALPERQTFTPEGSSGASVPAQEVIEAVPASETPRTVPEPVSSRPLMKRAKGRGPVTPRARRRARELGIDPGTVQGTGRGGRVRERDLLDSASVIGADGGQRQGGCERALIWMTARARVGRMDALIEDVRRGGNGAYGRREMMIRLVQVCLKEWPDLAPEPFALGESFGLVDLGDTRVEHWAPDLPLTATMSLGLGRVAGDPPELALNLAFDAGSLTKETAAAFLSRLCDYVEVPVLALVQ